MWSVSMIKPFNSAKKIVTIISFGLLFVTTSVFAQNNTSSTYSYFGLGELMQNSSGQSVGLGGTSMAYKGGSVLNLDNPASLSQIDSLKFHFNIGSVIKFTKLNQGNDHDGINDFNLSRIAIGFKVSPRYATAFSISPYSSLGYEITKREKVLGNDEYVIRSLEGTGGLNQFTWSNGVKINKDLSLGVNAVYIFGNNTRRETVKLASGGANVYISESELISNGLYFSVGAQYEKDFGNYAITLGGKYQPKLSVNAKQKVEINNTNDLIPRYSDVDAGDYDIPESFSVGFGVNKGQHFWIGGDYQHVRWSETEILSVNNEFVDRNKFSVGVEYNPNDGYARKFFKRLSYRLGGVYDTGYIKVEDKIINSVGVSAGVGIPMAQGKGFINLAVEFGTTGTKTNNLVREDYARITVDISLFERWFGKRKYN